MQSEMGKQIVMLLKSEMVGICQSIINWFFTFANIFYNPILLINTSVRGMIKLHLVQVWSFCFLKIKFCFPFALTSVPDSGYL